MPVCTNPSRCSICSKSTAPCTPGVWIRRWRISKKPAKGFPNIYFIIFDSYTNNQSLKKYWDFDWGYNIDGLKLSTSNGGNLSFKDSIIVGPKKFYSVYVLEQISTSSSYANLQYVYYSFKEGVVGFKEQGGKTWYLSN